jgi:molybdenum cofactor guanylyltransferase
LKPSLPATGDVAGFVLAGGRSSRMGRDKALVELNGRTLASRAVDLLRAAGLNPAIAGARSDLTPLAPVIADQKPDEGPLRGICSALASTQSKLALFTSVDLPLLPASLLAYLVRHALTTGDAVTIASMNGFAQTFPAVVRSDLLPHLREEMEAGRGGCFLAFHAAAEEVGERVSVIPVELLVQAGQASDDGAMPAYRWFLNVNAPDELEQAARLRVS